MGMTIVDLGTEIDARLSTCGTQRVHVTAGRYTNTTTTTNRVLA